MDFQNLLPEEAEVWHEIIKPCPPELRARMNPALIAEACSLILKMRKRTISSDERARLIQVLDGLGICGPASRARLLAEGREFKAS